MINMKTEIEESLNDIDLTDIFFENDLIINKYDKNLGLSVLNDGKKLRAKLSLALGYLFDASKNEVEVIAKTTEMVHNATLCHDDVIDQSLLRRQNPTINAQIDNKRSILLGDYILARTLTDICVLNSTFLVKELALCLKKLVDGEWMQFESNNPLDFNIDEYEQLAINKTGSLFSWALIAPFALKNSEDSKNIEALREIGSSLGVIFQIQDDLIDFSENSKKTRYLDLKNNNPNVVFSLMTGLSDDQKIEFKKSETFEGLSDDLKVSLNNSLKEAKEKLSINIAQFEKQYLDFCGQYSFTKKTKLELFFAKILKTMQGRKF